MKGNISRLAVDRCLGPGLLVLGGSLLRPNRSWPPFPLSSIKFIYQALSEKAMAPTPVLLPGKSHGRRSLVGSSSWGREESDTTERLHFHFSLSCIGEGNGNQLQYSCLGNPMNRGALQAAVYGVTQSWTRPKWLSSSSDDIQPSHPLSFPSPPVFNLSQQRFLSVVNWDGI